MKMRIIILFALLVGNSKSSERDDRNGQTEPIAGICLRFKWEVVLSVCDVNKDGNISLTDIELGRNKFTKLTKIKGQEKILREGMVTKWFKECVLWNQHEIAEKDYGAIQKDDFLKDKGIYVEIVKTCEDLWQNLVNTDNNDYLSEKEYTTFLRALGQTDEKKDKDLFKTYDPEDKGVVFTNLFNDWVAYITDDDCTKIPNVFDILKG